MASAFEGSGFCASRRRVEVQVAATETKLQRLMKMLGDEHANMRQKVDKVDQTACAKSANLLFSQLQLFESKITRFMSEITAMRVVNESAGDDDVDNFRRKLSLQTTKSVPSKPHSLGEVAFEIDSSPESESPIMQLAASGAATVNGYGSTSTGTRSTVNKSDDSDYEDDLKWRADLFATFNGEAKTSETDSMLNNLTTPKSLSTKLEQPLGLKINNVPPVPLGKFVSSWVGYIVNPSKFWLQYNPQLNEKILSDLQRAQNVLLRSGNWKIKDFQENMFVAALYSKDQFWYRAQIKRILGKENDKMKVEVFYIDYGNLEILTEDEVTILPPEFFQYEPQAIRCVIQHVPDDVDWDEDTIDLFKSSVDNSANSFLSVNYYDGVPSPEGYIYSVDLFINGSVNAYDLLPRELLCSVL